MAYSFDLPGTPNTSPEAFARIPRQPKFPSYRDFDGTDIIPIGAASSEIASFERLLVQATGDGGARFAIAGLPEFGVAIHDNLVEVQDLVDQGVPVGHRTVTVREFVLRAVQDSDLWNVTFTPGGIEGDKSQVSEIDAKCLGAFVKKYLSIAVDRLPGSDNI